MYSDSDMCLLVIAEEEGSEHGYEERHVMQGMCHLMVYTRDWLCIYVIMYICDDDNDDDDGDYTVCNLLFFDRQ